MNANMDMNGFLQSPIDLHIEQFYTFRTIMDIYNELGCGLDEILLDSSKEDSPFSHYSIIGKNPFLTVKYEQGVIYTKSYPSCDFKAAKETDIFSYLNLLLDQYSLENPTLLPFIGGGIGYFGYDLSKELEAIRPQAKSLVDIPDCYFVFYDNYLILDLTMNMLTVTGLGLLNSSESSVSAIKDTLHSHDSTNDTHQMSISDSPISSIYKKTLNDDVPTLSTDVPLQSIDFHSAFTKETYMNSVQSMKNYIEDGHIYIANMTHTYTSQFSLSPKTTYEHLRAINPAPFSAFMPLDGFDILSSSPERFIEIINNKVQTRPIKGTMPRGSNEEEDSINKNILSNSEKDKSELLMIVDLERNDLSKVCIPGSVKVTELFEIETYATVFHLVSTIEGILKPENTNVDCMKATFPGGSITGAPKFRAMEIIEELEPTRRNIYTGSIGYLGFDGNADFNIVIRTILLKNNKSYIGVGGGITWESDPAMEFQETLDKANALFLTLNEVYKSNQ